MTQYQYRPLKDDEIRLLHLEPGGLGDTLRCKLQHVSSANLPGYETLSYCWGAGNRSSTVEIEGTSLSVPKSTAEALLYFVIPKSVHVAKMHTIYASGKQNLISIGEDDGTVPDAIRDMDKVFEEMKEDTDSFRTFPQPGDPDYYKHNRSGLRLAIDLTPLVRLYSRPWFGRLWVVQEAALAPTNVCCCGVHTFNLTTSLRVARWLWMKRNFINLGHTDSESAFVKAGLMFKFADKELGYYQHGRREGQFQKNETTQEFTSSPTYWLLVGLQEFACREPIDHIYGMLGLYQQLSGNAELPELLRPDPNKSVRDVLRDATRLAILEGHNLRTLCAVHRRVEETRDSVHLPSWVPAWHRSWIPDLDPHPFSRDYQANGDRKLRGFAQEAQRFTDEISLEGTFVDGSQGAIAEVVAPSDVDSSSTGAYLHTVEELVRSHPFAKTTTNVEQTLATVLCAGKNAATESATDDDLLGYSELKTVLNSSNKTSFQGPNKESPQEQRAARYDAASRRAYHRRRFFITASGRAGLGPPTMREDDVVVILYGGELPFVLRRSGETYELVGPCYVQGIMEGQAVKEHEESGEEDVWFCIR